MEDELSRGGAEYKAANGESISNLGEKVQSHDDGQHALTALAPVGVLELQLAVVVVLLVHLLDVVAREEHEN